MAEFYRYRDSDYDAVCDFLIELNRADRHHINWNWARFEWMYGHPEFDYNARNAIGLWKDSGRVVGAAIYDLYFGEAFTGALPEYRELYPEILRYAATELKDGEGLGIAFHEDSLAEIDAALAEGFAPDERKETVTRLELNDVLRPKLPEGFSIAEPDPVRDLSALQWLFWQGFDHGTDYADFLQEKQQEPRPRKHYDPHLGLAAVSPSGEYAAFCCLWYHPDTDYAYVEPVCTVPKYRGRGIAKALLYESMNRVRALGAKEAYVISDQPFYGKLGFEVAYRFLFFWKKDQ